MATRRPAAAAIYKLCLLVAIDRTSKFAFVELHRKASRRSRSRLPPSPG